MKPTLTAVHGALWVAAMLALWVALVYWLMTTDGA
jgi:hypothetical protein